MRKLVRLLFDLTIAAVLNITVLVLVVVTVILFSWWSKYFDLTPADPDRPILWKLLVATPIIVAAGIIVMRSIFVIGGRVRDVVTKRAST